MQPLKTLSDKTILLKTYYDRMSNEDRAKVFKAYSYNSRKHIYELIKPELLDQEIIKKLL